MVRFKYSGRTMSGTKKGILQAESRREAMLRLRKDGIRVVDIAEVPETILTKDIVIGNPVKLEHLVMFLKQFSTLLKAGVSVVDATNILAQQTDSKQLAKALKVIQNDLKEGNPLSKAMEKHESIFEPLMIHMINAGEVSGTLDETLDTLGTQYEKQHRTRQKVISAFSYPIFVGVIAIAVVIFLLIGVVPTFVSMFADFGGELPAITQFVLNSSDFVQKFWYILIFIPILLFTTIFMMRKKPETKYYLDYALLKMPIFGDIFRKNVLARFTRTFSSMFSSSVPILQSLRMLENIVENEVIARVIRDSREALEQGRSLTSPMQDHWAFPPLVSHMIAIGEKTGSLDLMLAEVANFYEAEVEAATDRLKTLIEPLMIVILAGLVGVIVSAIMVPMFEIFNNVQTY